MRTYHSRDDTVCHPAIILNCFSVHNSSHITAWAGHRLLGWPKQLQETNFGLWNNSKLWRDGTLYDRYCVTYLLLPRLASGDISIIYNMKCMKYTYILYYQITGICISASDNSGKRKGTFKDFLKSVTNGKFYAAENEFEFVSDGKYSTIL